MPQLRQCADQLFQRDQPDGGSGFRPVDGVELNKCEYRVLEHICEHENDNHIMADITKWTGINSSNVTKASKTLAKHALVSKYRFRDNKKNIILKPTERGRQVYTTICHRDVEPVFRPFFDALDSLGEEDLMKVEAAIRVLTNRWNGFTDELMLEEIPKDSL